MVPKQYSIVKFDFESINPEYHNNYPFTDDGRYIFLGDIPNMPGHCVVVDYMTGQVFCGYHTDSFIELDIDET